MVCILAVQSQVQLWLVTFWKSFSLYTVQCKYLECVQQYIQVLRSLIWGTILTWVNYSVCGSENCLQWLMVSLNIFHVSGKNSYSVLSLLVYLLWEELAEILLCAHVSVHAAYWNTGLLTGEVYNCRILKAPTSFKCGICWHPASVKLQTYTGRINMHE